MPLLDIGHTPPAAQIREFYSDISIHIYDSQVVANPLGVPLVQHPIYPYDGSPLDDIMSYITRTSIRWGSDPRITSVELTETTYLFFRIACHSLWPISYLHTIPLEQCAFLYTLITDAPINFPHLFLCSLNEVHKSSSTTHALFHPVFIHRILLFLELDNFPAFEPVHVVAPIGATFLRQKAAHMRESSKRPRVDPSGTAPPPPFSIGTTSGEASADPVGAVVPPPSTLDDFDIRCTLETVMTVQVTHGQILVDMLDELCALRADLAHLQRSPSPSPFDVGF